MFPILYKKDETNFVHNGLGVLSEAISSVPEEELNSLFEIKIEYDSDGFLADQIENGMIVKAKANDKQDPQLFRIYAIEKDMKKDTYIIHGQHITNDLAHNFVEVLAVSNVTLKEAMETIQKNLSYPTRFNITSSNNTTKSSTRLYRTNPLQMIGGMEGSILQIWGGQIERDNFNLIMHARRGSDDGVEVTYRKNLTGLEAKFDESEVITRIFPFKYIEATEDEPEQLITIDGKFIDSPNIDKYPVIHIQPLDLSDDESIKNETDLYNASKDFFNTGAKDLPTVSMEVEFESLWDTEEYKDVASLELVGMGDTITVKHSKMGIDVKAQVVKVEYDSIAEKNKKVSVGNVKARLTDAVNKSTDLVNNIGEKINQANEKANEAIRAANGKNTNYYGPDEPTGDHLIEGDLWFRVVDGEYTRTYRYDGIEWQLVVSADIRDIEEEAQDARNKADEAVEKANLATGNANEAIEQAQDAFDEATNAHSAADAAKEVGETAGRVAGEARDQATTALENAKDALDGLKSKIDSGEYTDKIRDIEDKASDLRKKVSGAEKELTEHGGKINTIEHDVNEMDGKISTTINRISDMDDVLSDHTLTIEKNAKEIEAKAEATIVDEINKTVEDHSTEISLQAEALKGKLESTVYEKDKSGIINSIAQNKLDIEATSEGLSLAVSKIDNMQIGDRNLVLESAKLYESTAYRIAGYELSMDWVAGETWTVIIKGEINDSQNFRIWANGSKTSQAQLVNKGNGYHKRTFVVADPENSGTNSGPKKLNVYNFPSGGAEYAKIEWIKLVRGDKATEGWTAAPEDTEQEISTLKTELEFQAGLIESKISRDDFNTLKGTVDSHTTKITQTEKDIQSKASQDSVNIITKEVEHHESLITQNAEEIKNKISTIDANAKFATQSQLTQKADSLTSEIAKVQTNLDDLEIGGRNLSPESDKLDGHWSAYQGSNISYSKVDMTEEWGFSEAYRIRASGGTTQIKGVWTSNGKISEPMAFNVTYTYSLYVKNVGTQVFELRLNGLSPTGGAQSTHIEPNESKRVVMSGGRRKDYDWFQSILRVADTSHDVDIIVGREQVEKGKVTDWTPAPEDMTTNVQFSKLSQTVDSISTQVTKKVDKTLYDSFVQQTEKSLTSKISTTDADKKYATQSSLTQTAQGFQTSVNNKADKSTVTQLAGVVDSKVTSSQVNDLIASDKRIKDTRDDNEKPSYYFSDYPRQTVREFKRLSVMGISSDGTYGVLDTDIPWGDKSGGTIKQTLYTDVATYERRGINDNDTWEAWKKVADTQYVSTQITQTKNSIQQTITDTKNGLQSQISQISEAVNIRVKENDVINQINVDTSGILIQGKKLTLDGNVNVTGAFRVNNAHITSVDAGKMTTGTLDAGKVTVINLSANSITSGRVNANNVIVSATNGNAKVELDSTGLLAVDSSGRDRIHLGIRNLAGKGQSDPSTLRFFSGNGSVSAGIGMNVNDTFVIGSSASQMAMEFYSGKNTINYGQRFRFVPHDIDNGQYLDVFAINNTGGQGKEICLRSPVPNTGYVGSVSYPFWRVYSANIHETSTIENKTNISDCTVQKSYDVISSLDIKRYQIKGRNGNGVGEWKFGIVAEEAPEEILDDTGKAVSLYSFISHNANVTQDQIQLIEELQAQDEMLVLKIAELEERLNKLEAS
ncbi:hypothetical protein J14TS2_17170 [Bacillus sp. J14TS2]|uniref:phage tail spike protein n=1 Tax=Bacillus sp. J14TS2 TaxID=2807188 RepID=UPI001B278E8E|nr:phage tail spike protein [Bacillus sp. J14TS2]GIN71242.1 hypothetical protein J14TS2_17170 [Bacillus sp. J14TS2]